MAKASIKETVTKVHKLDAEGILVKNEEGFIIQTEDLGDIKVSNLLGNFNGELVKIVITTKEIEE